MTGMQLGMGLRLEPRLEQKLDIKQELLLKLPSNGIPGGPSNLKMVLREVPQVNDDGEINYLIAGGWARDILSGRQREHHDIDLIVLDDGICYLDTDNMHPECYFGILSTTEEEIRRNHITRAYWAQGRRKVYVPSPEFLVVSKIAPYQGNPSRDKDLGDILAVMKSRALNYYKLNSAFSIVDGLEDPQRYALSMFKLYQARNEDPAMVKDALSLVSKHLAEKLNGGNKNESA